MTLIRWNPANEVSAFPGEVLSMQREINRMFNRFFDSDVRDDGTFLSRAWTPAVDITEQDDEFVVKVELPGVAKDDVKITMQENILTIRGEKKQENETEGSNYHRVERAYGSFQRSFTLPSGVRTDKIEASHKDGILNIRLPKAEEARPKQIEVKVR